MGHYIIQRVCPPLRSVQIIGNKVLIIYANNDKVVPKRVAYYGKRKMHGSGLIEIKGNHFAYLKETVLLSKVIENYA